MAVPTSDQAAIRATIRALVAAGYKLDSVDDGESYEPAKGIDRYGDQIVTTEDAAIEAVTAVDVASLFVRDDQGIRRVVRFVMGNEPCEVIQDHSESLSPVLDPLLDSWES